jgi:hypothetical protein
VNPYVVRTINVLRGMTVTELRKKYVEVFGEESRSCNRDYLWKRIAWRLQALVEGDLSERARRRAEEIVDETDLRIRPPRGSFKPIDESSLAWTASYSFQSDHDRRLPMPGAILSRQYKGKTIRIMVLDRGFEFEGEVYRSLTAIARAVTGTHWNGFNFFGLQKERVKA